MSKKNNTRAEWQRDQNRADRLVQQSLDDRAAESSHMNTRADQRRLMRRFQNELREVEMENTLTKLNEAQMVRRQQIEQDTKFAEELRRSKNEALSEEKRRQQLHESSIELQDLENQLRSAYIAKEIHAQLSEKRLAAVQEKNREAYLDELERGLWDKNKEEENRRECEKLARNKQYLFELQAQMGEMKKKRELLFQEFLREKQMIDGIVRGMQEEDQRAEVERMEKLQKTKREVEDFKQAQEVWRKKERDEIEAEDKRILSYLENQSNEYQKRFEEIRIRKGIEAGVTENISRQILEIEKKKKEREDVLLMVSEEELMARQARRRREDAEKKLRQGVEVRRVFQEQTAEKRARREREVAEDRAERQRLLDELAQEARLEQMSREKQRIKLAQFRRDVEVAMEAKRAVRAQEMHLLIRSEEQQEEKERTRARMIEEERLRMLREHATRLFGFIPKSVLRESDLALLGPDYVDMYGAKEQI